ncbi:MAG: cupin domain-containing protein [Phycisphaeraceae bacterium]|nr:cupin domain-containing protein [Phycisphaeraceae bacterium]
MNAISARFAVTGVALLVLVGCQADGGRMDAPRGRFLTPQRMMDRLEWSDAERSQDLAVKTYRVTRSASTSFILLNTAEKPHVHDHHDLIVTVLSGQVRMHLALQSVDLRPGDVVDIPRGTVHWAQNIGKTPSEALAVFTPPYDGRDMREVDMPVP